MKVDDIELYLESCGSPDIVRRVRTACDVRLAQLARKVSVSTRDVFTPLGPGGKSVDEVANPGTDLEKRKRC